MALLRDILTPAWLQDRFLFGIVLTQDEGTAYPDSLFTTCIDGAIALAEATFGVPLADGLQSYSERYDYTDQHPATWFLTPLIHRPVRAVTGFARQVGDFPAAALPLGAMHITSGVGGQVQFIPGTQSVTSALVAPLISYTAADYIPAFYAVDYQAGFDGVAGILYSADLGVTTEPPFVGRQKATPSVAPAAGKVFTVAYAGTTKSVVTAGALVPGVATIETLTWTAGQSAAQTTVADFDTVDTVTIASTGGTPTFTLEPKPTYPVPAEIVEAIGLMASMLPLDTAGDLIAGAGIANYSVSIDGISQSIGTTSSATNAGYGARILSYQKRLKDIVERSERKHRPFEVFCV